MANGQSDMVDSLLLIREFDGTPSDISVNEYLNQINEVGKLNNWDETKKILIARIKMTGPACLFRDNDDIFKAISTWTSFCVAMDARFNPVQSTYEKFDEYISATQKKNETIFDFATRLNMLHDRAKPPPADESATAKSDRLALKSQDLKPLFLRGLLNKKLARRVLDRNPSSLKESINLASQLDANQSAFTSAFQPTKISMNTSSGFNKNKIDYTNSHFCQPPSHYSHGQTTAFRPSGTAEPERDFSRSQTPSSQYLHDPCDNRPHGSHPLSGRATHRAQHALAANTVPKCYRCGTSNHFAKQCPKRRCRKFTNKRKSNYNSK